MSVVSLDNLILTIRGEKVILDANLARLYGVPTMRLNEQVKRNSDRFPEDFAFRLSKDEFKHLKALHSASKSQVIDIGEVKKDIANCDILERLKFARTPPWAFTEHGTVMAASVLNSPEAVSMSVFVVRAFVEMRRKLRPMRKSSVALRRSTRRFWITKRNLWNKTRYCEHFGRN